MGSDKAYRPDIDGLRAVAVLSVIAFHYGGLLPGGFTGVDVFFVISGYLITSQLTHDIRAGTFSFLGFYQRRIRRILPALIVMLAVTLLAGRFLLMPGDYKTLAASAAAAAFGVSNFFFLFNTDYFAQASELMPLLHTWSLAVEEQFYLAWPLILLLIVAGRKQRHVAGFVIALTVIGFIASLLWLDQYPKAAFFVVLPRAWELLIGAALVFLPALPRRLGAATALGLALLVIGFVQIREGSFPGFAALLPCGGAALVVWPKERPTRADQWLGALRPIGLISYSLYLWHWPVWVFYRFYINSGTPLIEEAIALTMVSTAIAFLSWRFIEQPLRKLSWQPLRTVQAGLAACAAIFCAAVYVDLKDGQPERVPEAYAMRSLDAMWEWPCSQHGRLPGLTEPVCFFGKPWSTAQRKVLVWGDSHAGHFAPIIEAAAVERPDAFLLFTDCPAAFGGHVTRANPPNPDYRGQCKQARETFIKLLADDPGISLVILASTWSELPRNAIKDASIESDDPVQWLSAGLTDLIERAAAPGRSFLILGSVPQHRRDPTPCAVSLSSLLRAPCRWSESERDTLLHYTGPTDRMILKIAADHPNVAAVIPSATLCDAATCKLALNGEFLYRDPSHLRRNLSPATRRQFADLIGLTEALEKKRPASAEASAAPGD
ncbi:acyltransferase family protein [Bradyrhizobium cenepequi]